MIDTRPVSSLATMPPIMAIKYGDKYEINTCASVTPRSDLTVLLAAREARQYEDTCKVHVDVSACVRTCVCVRA